MNTTVILHLVGHTGHKVPRNRKNTVLFLLTEDSRPTAEQLKDLKPIKELYMLRLLSALGGFIGRN
jgi:hypothetical protein